MRAGPALDAEIARKIFGAVVVYDSDSDGFWIAGAGSAQWPLLEYSVDPDRCKSVVTGMAKLGWSLSVEQDDAGFTACFWKNDGPGYRSFHAETFPLAICAAALAVHDGAHIQNR